MSPVPKVTQQGLRRGVQRSLWGGRAWASASSSQTLSAEPGRGRSAPTQPPPSGVQQGSKKGLGGWGGGHPCPHKPPFAWPDAFGAWRQGLENGAAINSVRLHRKAVKPAEQRLECGGIQEGFSGRVWPDSIFGALGSKGSPPPSPPSPGHPAALSFPFPAPSSPKFL